MCGCVRWCSLIAAYFVGNSVGTFSRKSAQDASKKGVTNMSLSDTTLRNYKLGDKKRRHGAALCVRKNPPAMSV
jgi:hypothetical protein